MKLMSRINSKSASSSPRSSAWGNRTAANVMAIAILSVGFGLKCFGHERPFHGQIVGQTFASPTIDPFVYEGGALAEGRGTHLGTFSKVTVDTIEVLTGRIRGSFTMTAANGDLLEGVYDGYISFNVPPQPGASGTFSWVLNATLTGGTGRFLDATGEFQFHAEGKGEVGLDGSLTSDYVETYSGTIDY